MKGASYWLPPYSSGLWLVQIWPASLIGYIQALCPSSAQEFLAFSSGWSAQESCLLWQYTAENLPSSAQFLLFMCRARNTSLFLPVSSQRQFFPILARLFVKGKKSLLVHARCLQRLRGGTERIFLPESDPPYHAGGSAVFWGRETYVQKHGDPRISDPREFGFDVAQRLFLAILRLF